MENVQEGECPDKLDPQNPVYAEETSPSVIVNGFSERLWASHIQRIQPHSENLVGSRARSVPVQLALPLQRDSSYAELYEEKRRGIVLITSFQKAAGTAYLHMIAILILEALARLAYATVVLELYRGDPSSGEGQLCSRRPTLEQQIEPPEVRRGSGRRRNMKDEISTARDAITH
ncbi:hypothetical protein U0070_002647 [Myodes glareolus]|uniref:Uncharacterized protein n=1 Tax=Myodes glareolus TaxID=447135 RepID=A0AAW0IYI6_MYOGA